MAGTIPYTIISTTLQSTPTAVYTSAAVTTSSTTVLLIMVNIGFTPSPSNIQMTVGRYTSATPVASGSYNIVSNTTNISSMPFSSTAYYMAAYPSMIDSRGDAVNMSGFALDKPGVAGTFYYSVWMTSVSNVTLTGMGLGISIIKVSP